ncbi:hypothetical protein CTAYLR_006732 [Chrysophaeum taylorii]|uniref:Saccharopine dehydrogenase NADP binding domain-containing protein n=1 Tax=Chrysophaeum taylorii TaxID=2483200 RepID=A0AAD7UB34_9STRA|nr:hypothetical protein CTAYLR_006732 [Chrysophaeum taylorii]
MWPMTSGGKQYDLTIYGATGFTGRLAARYVARTYGTSIRWAVAGRSKGKLEKLQSELGGAPAVVVADGDDMAALKEMVSVTSAVAACAGPFARYGSKLVAACAELGTDYADITGESDWVREMITAYDDAARASGARIVHFCGHDCVPWDLSTLMLARRIESKGDALKKVEFYDELRSLPSGGTLETAFGILAGRARAKTAFDPLLRHEGAKATHKTIARNVNALDFSSKGPFAARSFFFMAGVNANCVKRSNALLGYGDLTYSEGLAFASKFAALANFLQVAVFSMLALLPPTRFLLRKFVLPKPGEGPSDEFMASGYLRVTGVAVGQRGTTAKSLMTFSVDPGYLDTARLVVESALALSLDAEKLKHVPGGVYTPAACQGTVLLDRICKTGTTFTFLDEGEGEAKL